MDVIIFPFLRETDELMSWNNDYLLFENTKWWWIDEECDGREIGGMREGRDMPTVV